MRRKSQTTESTLSAAIRQLSVILKPEGSLLETHVQLKQNWAIAFNGILAAGEPIAEDLIACPNAYDLKNALAKAGANFSITQLQDRLSIKADKFKALIPCVPVEDIQSASPDEPIADLSPNFIASIEAVNSVPERNEENVIFRSILLQGGSIFATDAKVMLEHWHGIDLPKLVLPKSVIDPLIKNGKNLSKFGFSKSSCTFHYEDGSWLRTQYFAEDWPDIRPILDRKANAHNLPEGLYEALDALDPFSETGFVYFDSNVIRSHPIGQDAGASYEVYGVPKGPILSIDQLKALRPYIKTIDFLVPNGAHTMTLFFGDKCRGAISGRTG